ncbi:hypothetical protein TUM18999_32300 [Pseudomonas tohonis]|uniref:Uncharacterized protein n=1 Tax=Pseudomonas tohonis TaxID=2725477 RepID=A0A6J4E6U4_9PSED|nr:hypothetical protein [Pseudomonas tohonis]BCG25039.1 hypothetical protein TUM18999_32300 [Pseudomonas tohonis]GJN55985.1 hypothetical protein TUM20286_57370 [Pseudomonas tohonis]
MTGVIPEHSEERLLGPRIESVLAAAARVGANSFAIDATPHTVFHPTYPPPRHRCPGLTSMRAPPSQVRAAHPTAVHRASPDL